MGSSGVGEGLLERDGALERIADACRDAQEGAGSVVVLEGQAGVGKSAVLTAASRRAREAGLAVSTARGGELERAFPFGVVRQLLRPAVEGRGGTKEPGRVAATDLAEEIVRGRPGVEGPRDLGTVLHGFYWLVTDLAQRGAWLMAVDDLHWADESSQMFCQYLARRIGDLPVVLLLAERRPEAGAVLPPASRLAIEPGAVIIQLEPLSSEAVSILAGRAVRDPDDGFCQAVHAASGGNPLLVHALLGEVNRQGIAPRASHAGRVAELAPEVVSRSVLVTLDRLPDVCRRLAEAVAVLGAGTETNIAATVAELDQDKAAIGADTLTQAGLLARDRPLSFLHPLLRRAVYEAMPAGQRGLAHRRAAVTLHGSGAPLPAVAAHLLKCEPGADPWVVEVLRGAASQAVTEGAPGTAVQYLERACAEPPSPATRADVFLQLGFALALTARSTESTAALRKALQLAPEPALQAQAGVLLAEVVGVVASEPSAGLSVLDELAGITHEAGPLHDIETARLALSTVFPTGPDPFPTAGEARRLAAVEGPLRWSALAALSKLALWSGEPVETVAKAAEATVAARPKDPGALLAAGTALLYADRFDAARERLEEAMEAGRRAGSPYMYGAPLVWRSQLHYRLGQLAEAEADALVARDIISGFGDAPHALTYPCTFLADVLIERGELAAAEEALAQVVPGAWGHAPWFLDTRGRVRTLLGRSDEARTDFAALQALADRLRSPSYVPWRSNLALLLAQAGERQDARRLAAEEVELACRQGASRAMGMAYRARGIVEGGAAGLDHLRQAVGVLEGSSALLEHARALCDLGIALRLARQPRAAREPLRAALDLSHRCGARALVERARDELAAAGGQPRRLAVTGVDALTASERRVAELAAVGRSNREIAQALFVSTWTVASHLTATYRKLGIAGRAHLAAALATGE